jgi:hypothetical protein
LPLLLLEQKQKRFFLPLSAAVLACLCLPAASLSATEKSGPDTLAGKEGLKVRFLKQMAEGTTALNLGLAYWIELNRQGHLYRTSNLAKFQSGDQIRFHVLPNADGYAYIVMHQGTSGTKSVLFPPVDTRVNNFVKRGAECVVPKEGSLEFDQIPGTEQVGLLLSRSKIDPVAYLSLATPEAKSQLSAAQAQLPPAQSKSPLVHSPDTDDLSDLEKSYDAIFSKGASSGNAAQSTNPGALELLSSDRGVVLPEEPEKVLSSPSTAVVVSDDPNAVVSVDFALKHD